MAKARMLSNKLPARTMKRIYVLGDLAARGATAEEYAAAGMQYTAQKMLGRETRLEIAHKKREKARLERVADEERILAVLREAGKIKPRVLAEKLGMPETKFFNKTRPLRKDGRIVVIREHHHETYYLIGGMA